MLILCSPAARKQELANQASGHRKLVLKTKVKQLEETVRAYDNRVLELVQTIVEHLNKDNIKLKEDLDRMNEAIKAKEKGAIETAAAGGIFCRTAAYQKLLKENARLEQRYENLQGEMSRVRGGHRRTPSNVSLGSVRSDDVGYGSIRSKDKENVHLKLDDVHWDDHSVKSEKNRLEKKLENMEAKEEDSPQEENS
ncbi:unconventional myosin-Vb [Caerostris extrusa]|uniref:Unconventional myosin-Vb n=1 Tax=Caerostris extrusa TaxID=172846 RepID=A0AAV4W9S1_CAEEX|nr:unconventional myosin-Vb [Caerostris extrusa]